MSKSFMNKNYEILSVLIFSVIYLLGCTSFPTPQSSDSSMIILSMKGKRKPLNVGIMPTQVFIANVDDKGFVLSEIPETHQKGKYFYFTNLSPGKYRIARGIYSKTNSASTSLSRRTGRTGVAFTVGTSKTSITNYTFSDELRERTEVTLLPGKIAYMGHFSFIDSAKIFPPGGVTVIEASGERTTEGEKKAIEYFKKKFNKSPWVTGLDN